MTTYTQLQRLSNYFLGNYKTVLCGRVNWITPIQSCDYTKKSAEQRLGLNKPKRPLTPFFKFMSQMRPALLAKNPGISSKEAIAWTSKHWQQLDMETKTQMAKEYQKDLEDYNKIKAMYETSLTEEQKADIKRVKEEMAQAKEKRKLKAEYKELGRPKKPMSSYFIYMQSRKDNIQGKTLKEYQETVKKDWINLPDSEKAKLEKQAQTLMDKYKKDLQAWELKMVSIGRTDLVRSKPAKEKKTKKVDSSQQELGCSDDADSILTDSPIVDMKSVQSIDKDVKTSQIIPLNSDSIGKDQREMDTNHQSTGEQVVYDKQTISDSTKDKKSKGFISSIKSFFKH